MMGGLYEGLLTPEFLRVLRGGMHLFSRYTPPKFNEWIQKKHVFSYLYQLLPVVTF